MKANTSNPILFKTNKSYSVEEVLAAGGTTAFSHKQNKDTDKLVKALQEASPVEPFSQEEWDNLSKQLENDK